RNTRLDPPRSEPVGGQLEAKQSWGCMNSGVHGLRWSGIAEGWLRLRCIAKRRNSTLPRFEVVFQTLSANTLRGSCGSRRSQRADPTIATAAPARDRTVSRAIINSLGGHDFFSGRSAESTTVTVGIALASRIRA